MGVLLPCMLIDRCLFTHSAVRHRCSVIAKRRFAFFSTIEAAAADWDFAAPPENVFLSRCYLRALQDCLPPGMRIGYLVFYENDEPIGVALLQWVYFDGRRQVRQVGSSADRGDWFRQPIQLSKRLLINSIRGHLLVCGNLLLTGWHSFYFDKGKIAESQSAHLLCQALKEVARQSSPALSGVLVKDVAPAHAGQRQVWRRERYWEFCIQPNMVMPLPYRTFEEYLEAMTTKYRTRAKRAFKKAAVLERRRLALHELRQQLPELHRLYLSVARRSDFHIVDLHEDYLPALQRALSERFHLVGWYRQKQLVGFHTAVENGSELEAHFLGYEESANAEHQLYLNMLYELVRLGIERSCQRVVFGRTALEIKSSVGAVPHTLYNYLQPQTVTLRRLGGALLHYLMPEEPWVERHPFKKALEAKAKISLF